MSIPKLYQYQQECYEKAVESNSIVYLPTGTGKTLISVCVIKHFLQEKPESIVIFLAPTRPLVQQQGDTLKAHLPDTTITMLEGDHDLGQLNDDQWKQKYASSEIFVCTPANVQFLLMTAFLKMKEISLIVFDECHHCTKQHPYNVIMSTYYHPLPEEDRPHILGLTASPVKIAIRDREEPAGGCLLCKVTYTSLMQKQQHERGAKHQKRAQRERVAPRSNNPAVPSPPVQGLPKTSKERVLEEMSQLESALDATIITSTVERTAASPSEKTITFQSLSKDHIPESIRSLINSIAEDRTGKQTDHSSSPVLGVSEVQKLTDIATSLGLVALYWYVEQCGSDSKVTRSKQTAYTNLRNQLFDDIERGRVPAGLLCGPKLSKLLEEVKQLRANRAERILIFAQERKVATLLGFLLKGQPLISPDKTRVYEHGLASTYEVAVLLGQTPTARSREIVDNFRGGRFTVLIATSVAEEGLDIQKCNAVITFDDEQMIPKSYTQCKGRARQQASQFIFFSDKRSLEKLREMESLTHQCIADLHRTKTRKTVCTVEDDTFETSIGAKIIPTNAREVFQLYIRFFEGCQVNDLLTVLPTKGAQQFQSACSLPMLCRLTPKLHYGKIHGNRRDAEGSAMVSVCRFLHDRGCLNDHLLVA